VGGAARGIAEADGKRAGLFCPGDGVVTRAARRPRTTRSLLKKPAVLVVFAGFVFDDLG
jgi:hypothetical protein